MNNEYNTPETPAGEPVQREGSGWKWLLAISLMVALAGNIYLLKRSNNLNEQISQMQSTTDSQLAKINAAAEAAQEDSRKQIAALNDSLNTYHSASNSAVTRVRAEAKKQSDQLGQKFDEQQQAITGEISQVKTVAEDANTKIGEVSTDVGSVKTDVSGVKTELATAQTALNQHSEDLKRMVGDMGAMSGLIATNSKDLSTLRELGERNYYEFTLNKGKMSTKVGGVLLTLKKADPKNSRFTLEVVADDKKVEKRDRTINEPVQIYVAGGHLPNEIVVNEVKKDQVVGYLSTPKVTLSRR